MKQVRAVALMGSVLMLWGLFPGSAAAHHQSDTGSVLVRTGNRQLADTAPCPAALPTYAIWRDTPFACIAKQSDAYELDYDTRNLSGRCGPVGGVGIGTPQTWVWQCPYLHVIDRGDHLRVYGDLPGGTVGGQHEREMWVNYRITWIH